MAAPDQLTSRLCLPVSTLLESPGCTLNSSPPTKTQETNASRAFTSLTNDRLQGLVTVLPHFPHLERLHLWKVSLGIEDT